MKAHEGDVLRFTGRTVGTPDHHATVVKVLGQNGEPTYRVRYEDGHETEIFPGPGCVIETQPAQGVSFGHPHHEGAVNRARRRRERARAACCVRSQAAVAPGDSRRGRDRAGEWPGPRGRRRWLPFRSFQLEACRHDTGAPPLRLTGSIQPARRCRCVPRHGRLILWR
ncbi:DUF1918 domain-containing protein [Streptomyces sp. NPDC046942]|uniref:DUF1918 domain-containing protein n=1 Tax=Streptomyces sp. NPDC046942 TaxID=3155137 RepID=UPI0033D2881B